jgi:bacteriophage CI repressor helix-turn-helix domain
MNTLKDRLEELMTEYGLDTQQQLADFAGVSKGLVGQWFNGSTGLGAKPLSAFDKKTRFSINWLTEGTGDKYKTHVLPAITESESEDRIRFPRLNAEATCGAGTINDHYIEVVDYVTVASAWAREKLGGNLNKIQVITARGDSMEPTIEDGDVMFVDTAVEAFEGDGLYLLWYIDGLKAKRLQSTVGGGLMIISDNSSYRTETVSGEDLNAVHIIGRIRGAWRLSQF